MSEKRRGRRPKNPKLAADINSLCDLVVQAADENRIGVAMRLFRRASKVPGAPKGEIIAAGLRIMKELEWAGILPPDFVTGWELICDVTPAKCEPDPARNVAIKAAQRRVALNYAADHSLDQITYHGMAKHIQTETQNTIDPGTVANWLRDPDFLDAVESRIRFRRVLADQKAKWDEDGPERARRAEQFRAFSEFIGTVATRAAAP